MKEQVENEMKLEFISKASNEAFARITVAAFASQLDPTIEELADIKTAISEAVTNCIIHAYENRQGIIKINAKLKENELIVEISDNGKGINTYSMISVAYKAIQEQQEQIEQLQEKDKQKDEIISDLIKRIETLEKEVNK